MADIPKKIADVISAHAESDRQNFSVLRDTNEEIRDDIKTIKENHLAHIQASMTKLETEVSWMQKFIWIILTGVMGGFIAQLWQIINK